MEKVNIRMLRDKRSNHQKISMLAVSDYPFAKLAEAANIDTILVGDSIGMTVYG